MMYESLGFHDIASYRKESDSRQPISLFGFNHMTAVQRD